MKTYDVACFDTTSGKLLWSVSQEAESPAEAIAQACLMPWKRSAFVQRIHLEGLDELETLQVPHPAHDLADGFEVRAEPW